METEHPKTFFVAVQILGICLEIVSVLEKEAPIQTGYHLRGTDERAPGHLPEQTLQTGADSFPDPTSNGLHETVRRCIKA